MSTSNDLIIDNNPSRWEIAKQGCKNGLTKTGRALSSDKAMKVYVVLGLIGALAATAGALGFFGHMPYLNAMGNYAIIAMAVGGASAILGIVAVAVLVKRIVDKKRADSKAKRLKAFNDGKKDLSVDRMKARLESIAELDKDVQPEANKLSTGNYVKMQSDNKYGILVATFAGPVIFEKDLTKEQCDKRVQVYIDAGYTKSILTK